ncbi:unnamed protein product, partial [Thlaspi arvense]
VKANAVRALWSISKYVKLQYQTSNHEVLPLHHHHLSCVVDSSWLERTVQAFISSVTTGNVKVQWNVCHALSNLFSNETVKTARYGLVLLSVTFTKAPSVFSILLLLLRDASNLKIRIQAAAALAVPATPLAYGRSFLYVVKGVEHTLQSLNSDRETTPTNFKYKRSLENQLTSTMLHLLSLVSSCHCDALTDFLLKKASFLDEWLRGLCVTLKEEDNASRSSDTSTSGEKQKKELISKAIRSLARILGAGYIPEMALKSKPMQFGHCGTSNHEVLPLHHHHLSCVVDSSWLERTVQAFISSVTTGNVKVQWNVCHALSNLFSNETVKLQDMDWAPSVFSILLLLLRDASNLKIRIQAAAALAVPATPLAYGRSFLYVVKGVEHTLQSLNSDRETTPTNFKYKRSLENQLTSTMLHLLSLVSSCHCDALTDFLLKKASFLDEWLRGLCVTLKEEDNASRSSDTSTSGEKQKKELISKAIRSLARILGAGYIPEMALKLQELDSNVN